MKYGSIKGYIIDWESNRTTSRTMKSMPQQSRAYSSEMFVNMLTVHCDQNNSYEITINGFKVRKINEIRNVIFISSSTQLVNIPTSALTLRKVSHSGDRKLRFLFRLFF